MDSISIGHNAALTGTTTRLPASKSLSNRALIINALAGSTSRLVNLSDANDTVLMKKLLESSEMRLDAEDAGTTMRFLTAYMATRQGTRILTGTERMKQRPIGILTRALKQLGAGIRHLGVDGFPPLEITGLKKQRADGLTIRSDISSQFISALMMIGPALPMGLTLHLEGRVGSRPYIDMTTSLMRHFGASVNLTAKKVEVSPGGYHPASLNIEPDWSAAGYWFSFTALAESADILLPGLSLQSLQGDRIAEQLFRHLGVVATEEPGGVHLTKGTARGDLTWDFAPCPDLCQTVAVACAAKGIRGVFSGLESLRIKETDRIRALQTELAKLGAQLVEKRSTWELVPSDALPSSVLIRTYKDHRTAMAFAPLATLMEVEIENPSVVNKSYPGYWEDLTTMGFQLVKNPSVKR